MKIKLFIALIFLFNLHLNVDASENKCLDFKKFSANYIKCKANQIKDGTVNIINDTKDYQKQECSKEKGKLDKIKEQF